MSDTRDCSDNLPFRTDCVSTLTCWARFSGACLLASSVLGCDDPSDPPKCSAGAVAPITVSAGTTPTISWAADCPAIVLAVYDPASGLPLWELHTGLSQISKPVTYGSPPPGVTEAHDAEALQTGITYDAFVGIRVGQDTVSAIQPFTP